MIWLVGQNGMLGTELRGKLQTAQLPFYGTDIEVDITDPEALESFSKGKKVDWIINCSAYTAVDRAEGDVKKAYLINATGAGNLAAAAKKLDAPLIHISTDYVFPGTENRELKEDDNTGPLSVYGQSKLAGEKLIQSNWQKHYIIRTAWLYGKYGSNFVNTMLRLMEEKDELTVVDDQIGSPTWTSDLADAIIHFIKKGNSRYGIYNFSGAGRCSWFGFAMQIYNEAKALGILKTNCRIKPVHSSDFPAKAKRPAFSLLSKRKIEDELRITVPHWEISLKQYLKGIDAL